jgi:hypothetical protein
MIGKKSGTFPGLIRDRCRGQVARRRDSSQWAVLGKVEKDRRTSGQRGEVQDMVAPPFDNGDGPWKNLLVSNGCHPLQPTFTFLQISIVAAFIHLFYFRPAEARLSYLGTSFLQYHFHHHSHVHNQ